MFQILLISGQHAQYFHSRQENDFSIGMLTFLRNPLPAKLVTYLAFNCVIQWQIKTALTMCIWIIPWFDHTFFDHRTARHRGRQRRAAWWTRRHCNRRQICWTNISAPLVLLMMELASHLPHSSQTMCLPRTSAYAHECGYYTELKRSRSAGPADIVQTISACFD